MIILLLLAVAAIARGILAFVPTHKRWVMIPPSFMRWRRKRRVYVSWLEKNPSCKRRVRYLGYRQFYYDGPIPAFGFWWFHVSLDCHNDDWGS